MTDFSSLVLDSQALTRHIPSSGVPHIQRNVAQLQQAASKLHHAGTTTTATTQQLLLPNSATIPTIPIPTQSQSSTSAQLFLAKKGVDIQQQAKFLQSLSLATTAAANAPTAALTTTSTTVVPASNVSNASSSLLPLDVYLNQQHHQLLSSILQENSIVSSNNFHRCYVGCLENEWSQYKREMMEQMGFRDQTTIDIKTPKPNRSQIGGISSRSFISPSPITGIAASSSSSLTDSQSLYSQCLTALNDHRLRHQPFPLITALRDAAVETQQNNPSRHSASSDHEIIDLFNVLRFLIGEQEVKDRQYQRHVLTEQHYAIQYQAGSRSLKKQMIQGAKLYCQQLFLQHMKTTVNSHPTAATIQQQQQQQQLQSSQQRPILTVIQSYVTLTITGLLERFRDYQDNVPVWPVIFYSLRAGEWKIATEMLTRFRDRNNTTNSDVAVISRCLTHLTTSTSSASPTLTRQLWESLNDEYNREILSRSSSHIDPFKLAVYQLIGHFPPHPQLDVYQFIIDSTESYLWYKLSLVYDDDIQSMPDSIYAANDQSTAALSSSSSSLLSLAHLQTTLTARGEQHFNHDGQHPLIFFKVLLLAQCFEQAIYYLVRTPHFSTAVHAAIALQYYGLLHAHYAADELLMQRDPGSYAINLHRIVGKYVEPWVQTNTETAFQYLYTLYQSSSSSSSSTTSSSSSPTSSQQSTNASLLAMRDLLLHSKATSLLVGDVNSGADSFSSSSSPGGLFFHYFPSADVVIILQLAAEYCNNQGDHGDAVMLLMLGNRYDDAAIIARRELAKMLNQNMRDNKRSQMIELATRIIRISSSSSSSSAFLSSSSLSSLSLLLSLCQFFDNYHAGPDHYTSALDCLSPLRLFPPADSNSLDDASVRLLSLPIEIQRVIGIVALALMDIYYSKFSAVSSSTNVSTIPDDREAIRRECRDRGRALVDFVGMNGGVIGVEVQAKLLKLEALMA